MGGTSVSFLSHGAHVVQELSGTIVLANPLNGPRIDEARRMEGTTTSNYLTDALGSAVALTNSMGAIATSYTYRPYRAATASGTTSDNRYQYAGRDNDGTGLHYYRARHYYPTFGRFVSEDPIGFAGGVNLYAYMDEDPITGTGPSGFFPRGLPFEPFPAERGPITPPVSVVEPASRRTSNAVNRFTERNSCVSKGGKLFDRHRSCVLSN